MANALKPTFKEIKWGGMGSFFNFLIALIFAVILARKVGPVQSGLFALSFLPIQFFITFEAFALSTILIQQKSLSDAEIWSFGKWFWACGALFFAICAALSPFMAWFYTEPQLIPLMLVNALIFFVNPLGRIQDILLRRTLQSKTLATADWHGTFLGGLLALIVVQYSATAWALVAFWLLRFLIRNLKIRENLGAPQQIPPFSMAQVKRFKKLSLAYTGAEALAYFKLALPAFWIGKQHGAEVLAFFRLAQNTAQMPVSILGDFMNKTLMPIISGFQENGKAKAKTSKWSLAGILWLSFPFLLAFTVYPEELIYVVYGQKWATAALFLRMIGVLVVLGSLQNFFIFLFHGLGQGTLDLKMQIIGACSMVVALWLSYQQSVYVLALATTCSLLVPIAYGYFCMRKATPYQERFLLPFLLFITAFAILAFVLWQFKVFLMIFPPFLKLLLLSFLTLILWLFGSFWLGKKYVLQVFNFIRRR